MIWVIIVLIVAGAVVWVWKYSQPEGFAQGIAKAQLGSLNSIKKSQPELEDEELYIQALARRPGYTMEDARQLVERAKKNNKSLSFQKVVWELVHHEYIKRLGSLPTGSGYQAHLKEADRIITMERAVKEIIPEEL